jgi:hypothetical protein
MLLCRSLRFLWDNVAEGNQLHSFNLAQGVHVSLSNPTATDETDPHHFTRHRSSPPQANFLCCDRQIILWWRSKGRVGEFTEKF